MSKDTSVKKQENDQPKEVSTITAKEAISTLRSQLKEYLQQADQYTALANEKRTLATKSQGALEVLLQLYPEEPKENGVAV